MEIGLVGSLSVLSRNEWPVSVGEEHIAHLRITKCVPFPFSFRLTHGDVIILLNIYVHHIFLSVLFDLLPANEYDNRDFDRLPPIVIHEALDAQLRLHVRCVCVCEGQNLASNEASVLCKAIIPAWFTSVFIYSGDMSFRKQERAFAQLLRIAEADGGGGWWYCES